MKNSFQIFPGRPSARGISLAPAYDVSQTYGREVRAISLADGSPEMEKALSTVLNYAVVPVVLDQGLEGPARYDEKKLELAVNPDFPDHEMFAALAAEVAPRPDARQRGRTATTTGRTVSWTRRACPVSCAAAVRRPAGAAGPDPPGGPVPGLDAPGGAAGAGQHPGHGQENGELHRTEYRTADTHPREPCPAAGAVR